MMKVSPRHKQQLGFTFVEIAIIAPIVILVIGAFIGAIVSMTGAVLRSGAQSQMVYSIQDALNRIDQDVKMSSGYLAQNSITLTSPQGYNNDTTSFYNASASQGQELILNVPATVGNPQSTSAAVAYIANSPNACGPLQDQNTPLMINIIYFVQNGTLYRRVIMPSNYATVGVCNAAGTGTTKPWQQPSCTSTGGFCAVTDDALVNNVSGFNLQYFNSSNPGTPDSVASNSANTTAVRASALQADTTVVSSITTSQSVAGQTLTQSSSLQATRLDTYMQPLATNGYAAPAGVTLTANSTSQITVAWSAPSGYTPSSYSIAYSTNSNFSNATTVTGITSTSKAITGLATSTQYYFRVWANTSGGFASAYSGGTASTYTSWASYSMVASVGDWNGDGNNDLIGYNKTTGNLELHLGNGNGTFGPSIVLANIGTSVQFLTGPGPLPGSSAPIIWWANTDTTGHFLTSNGSTGVTGAPQTSLAGSGNWNGCNAIFAAPHFYTNGSVTLICKSDQLYMYALQSNGNATFLSSFGSGWDSAYPGNTVFGGGDESGDGIGDVIAYNPSGILYMYTGTGTGTTSGSGTQIGSGWTNNYVTGGYDINNDGQPDFLRLVSGDGLYYYSGVGAGGVRIN